MPRKQVKTMASSSTQQRATYDVFLSFRGEDTRKNFTDHLYTALLKERIRTFRDDEEIRRGENIELEIQRAIRESRLSIIVLSKDYASSRWCLDELVLIMELHSLVGHVVLPVFYGVDRYHVRDQSGWFGDAFASHEEKFKDRVEQWREALRQVADMGDMVFRDGYLSQFIGSIVKEVENKLSRTLQNVAPYLVGIDSLTEAIDMWLQNDKDVGITAIYGIGGIGKTTIAKRLFNQNFKKFDAWSFLANVKDTSEQPNGLVRLQRQLLSDLLKGSGNKIYNVDEGIDKISDALRGKRVLLVLDDLDQVDQYNAIIGMRQWFHPGSKIIITTRHDRLPGTNDVTLMFKVRNLDEKESLQLFSWYAFGQDHPPSSYTKLAEKVAFYCGGIPLCLQVLGSSFSRKTLDVWESSLQELERIPDNNIQKTLSISYESLEDDHDKNLFLDVACFLNRKEIHHVLRILDGCKFYTILGVQNLLNRCLITINEKNKLIMHQSLVEMGKEIVRQESLDDPGKRSRLSDRHDAIAVLRDRTGTESIRGLCLNLPTVPKDSDTSSNYCKRCHYDEYNDKAMVHHHQEEFSKRRRLNLFSWQQADNTSFSTRSLANMKKLKLLQLDYARLEGSYADVPKSLVWLHWHGFPLNTIPTNLSLKNLAVLEMRRSSLKYLWKGTRLLTELKILDLSHSCNLVKTPDFTGLPKLERVVLKGCIELVEVDESIGDLKRLVVLNLKDCKSLSHLPRTIGELKSLEELFISGCSDLGELPAELAQLVWLRVLEADRIGINLAQSSDADSDKLSLSLLHSAFRSFQLSSRCAKPTPYFSLANLPSNLMSLSLSDCNLSDKVFPKDFSHLPLLVYLDLSGNAMSQLPDGINNLNFLESLVLDRCTKLRSLPQLPTSLDVLKAEDCTSLERIVRLPNWFQSLELEVYGCEKLVEVQGFYRLESIKTLEGGILNNMGLFDLEPLESIEVNMSNALSCTEMKTTIQALHECGICSIFLPGNEVPDWFNHRNEGSSISFDIPTDDMQILGLSLCVAYACADPAGCAIGFYSDENYAKVYNITKGTKWTYSPMFYGIPEANNDMLWLSYWTFEDLLDAGDEVDISIAMSSAFQVKQCGIHLVYKQQETSRTSCSKEIVESSSSMYQTMSDIDMSSYELVRSNYFLCHHKFPTHQGVSKDDDENRDDPGGYEYLFDQDYDNAEDEWEELSEYEEYDSEDNGM